MTFKSTGSAPDNSSQPSSGWRTKVLRSHWPWGSQPIRPADVYDGLRGVMLARENSLEDVYYRKIVPNQFVVEVSADTYARNFQTIESQVAHQWRAKLIEELTTTNSRLGRREYAFGGPVTIELHPVQDLRPNQARIRWMVGSPKIENFSAPEAGACLEMAAGLPAGGRRWRLGSGITNLGRYDICEVYLDLPEIQEKRLISGQHAYIRREPDGGYRLFDGSPAGKASMNGTFVNNQRVPAGGQILRHGDIVLLAAVDPSHPRPGAPGSAAFTFYLDCPA